MAEGDAPAGGRTPPGCLLPEWRQGDCVVGPRPFYCWVAEGGGDAEGVPPLGDGGDSIGKEAVDGLVVITQSCDIEMSVEDCRDVEVAPLIAVDAETMRQVEQVLLVRRALVPGVASRGLVADLSRVMTVEKAVVAGWSRTPGCSSDGERRAFARALARKHRRFAFPDDFGPLVRRLVERMKDKHGRQSDEGRALRALQRVRVRAAPRWDAPEVEVTFFFVRSGGMTTFEGQSWETLKDKWVSLVSPSGRYRSVIGEVGDMDYFTMKDLFVSDPLDLDHLSGA